MKKLLLIPLFTILFLTSLFFILRNDGLHSWTKDFDEEILEIVAPKGFLLKNEENSNFEIRNLNIYTSKFLFKHTHSKAYLFCYMRSDGDHVKAFYFQYHRIDKPTLDYFKSEIAKDFVGYEVDWIENK